MREYTKIKGSYMKIGKFIQTIIYDSFNPESMFNTTSTDDEVTTQLQKDVGRTRLISIDEDYKDFESKCFDCKHQQGGFIQGAFTGAVFSETVFMPIIINYVENSKEFKNNTCKFIYQGDDKDGFGFSAVFFDSPDEKILALTFVNDFKKHDTKKSGVFILLNDINNPELINNIKQEIQNNIKSAVVKKWLMLELFNRDGSFNEAGIVNVNDFLLNNRQNNGSVRLNNFILIDRINDLRLDNFTSTERMAEMYSGPSYFSRATSYLSSFFWSSDCKNSDEDSKQNVGSKISSQAIKSEDSKQNVDSKISSQAITSEQVIDDRAAIIVVTDILHHNQETSFEDLVKIKETIKGY